jgi:uncharacterized YccA/Bax inhibitor family protein
MAQNPVIARFGRTSGVTGPIGTPSGYDLQKMYDAPAYTGPRPAVRYLTLDDVVQRTAAMLAVLLATGAVAWAATSSTNVGPLVLLGVLGGAGIGLYMAFTGKANAITALLYSAFEGLALGAISRLFNDAWHGIVIQAVTGTVCVAGAMLFVYKIGAVRVTPRFTRIVVGSTIGVVGLMAVNLLAYLVHPGGLGLRSGGALAVVFSLVVIALAAANLVVDFDAIEKGIRNGADQRFAWYAAFGLMVTLVWLYLEILRLLSYFRE